MLAYNLATILDTHRNDRIGRACRHCRACPDRRQIVAGGRGAYATSTSPLTTSCATATATCS